MNAFNIIGLMSTIALALPILTLLLLRLSFYRSLPALLFYYILVFSFNLLSLGYIDANREVVFYHGTISNLLDVPLILLFLTYFSRTVAFRKKLLIAIITFVVFEIVIVSIYGLTRKATTIILGPGLLIVLVLSSIFFIHQIKIAVMHYKAIGKAIMIASVVFAYAGYSFVYAVYYLVETPYKDDAELIFYFITIVNSVAMTVGIIAEQKRVRQLNELQTTRKELKEIYNEDEKKTTASPIEAALFKFDSTKQWN